METISIILAVLFILAFAFTKLMVSFAKMDEKSREIFKNKQK